MDEIERGSSGTPIVEQSKGESERPRSVIPPERPETGHGPGAGDAVRGSAGNASEKGRGSTGSVEEISTADRSPRSQRRPDAGDPASESDAITSEGAGTGQGHSAPPGAEVRDTGIGDQKPGAVGPGGMENEPIVRPEVNGIGASGSLKELGADSGAGKGIAERVDLKSTDSVRKMRPLDSEEHKNDAAPRSR